MQAIAIPVVAIAWGAYTFYFEKIWSPAIAPINLTTEISINEAGSSGVGTGASNTYQEIELSITATNPSTRDVYLLSNYWRVMGIPIETRLESHNWVDNANDLISKQVQPANAGTHYTAKGDSLVAAGSVFSDVVLHPNESISASFVFYVPQGAYDVLNVDVNLPTTATQHSAIYVHTLAADGTVNSRAYRLKEDGEVDAEIEDFMAAYRDPDIQMQLAGSSRQLSLWQEAPQGLAEAKSH